MRQTFSALILITALCLSSVFAAAGEIEIGGTTITRSDVSQFLSAFHTALTPNDSTIPLVVTMKKPEQMPSYDPQCHYAGLGTDNNGSPNLHVWVNSSLKGADLQKAIASGFILAITDGGYAGKSLKHLFDVSAQQDSHLPTNAPDPFFYRHRLAESLAKLIDSVSTPPN